MSKKRSSSNVAVQSASNGQVAATAENETAVTRAPAEKQLAILTDALETLRRQAFAQRHGLQYRTARDLYKQAGYPATLDFNTLYDQYQRDSISGRVVDMVPETTWRRVPEILDTEKRTGVSESDSPFVAAWQSLAKRLQIWTRLERADKLARLGRYSVLLVGTTNTTDQSLAEPIARVSSEVADPNGVLYLQAYSEARATIVAWETNPADERFGLPTMYQVDVGGNGVEGFKAGSRKVHHSRVIHIAEGLLQDDVFGRPVLARVYNDVHDLQKIRVSTAEAFWQQIAGILTAKIASDVKRLGEQEQIELDEQLQALYHDLKRTFYAQGMELERLAGEAPTPKEAADLYFTLIATGSEIPLRVLLGNETGERASTEDQKQYLGTIAERQTTHAEPNMLRPLIDLFIRIGALPTPEGGDFSVVWPTLFPQPESEIADANLKRAQAAQALAGVGGDALALVEIDEERNIWLRPTGERGVLEEGELGQDDEAVDDGEEPGAEPPPDDDEE